MFQPSHYPPFFSHYEFYANSNKYWDSLLNQFLYSVCISENVEKFHSQAANIGAMLNNCKARWLKHGFLNKALP